MKNRRLFLVLAPLAILAVLCAGFALGIRSVLEGGAPMEDGRSFAQGSIERVADGIVSAFIVQNCEGVVLVDAGMDPEAVTIKAALARRGQEVGDVQAILLTHGHGDHLGGVSAFPDASLFVLAPDADLVRGERVADNVMGKGKQPEPTGFVVTRELHDGDLLTLGALEVEVFALPGHSRGSAAFLIHGVLLLGDAAASTADGRLTGPPPLFSADREAGMASLRALAARLEDRQGDIEWLVPSHQGALEGPDALMAWAE